MAANGSAANIRANLLIGASIGALLISSPAYAQPANQPPTPATPTPTPTTTDAQQQAQDSLQQVQPPVSGDTAVTTNDKSIVVTGIAHSAARVHQPRPGRAVSTRYWRSSRGQLDTADMLQSSPIAAGSTQITSALSSNFVTNGGPGAQTIDLRGLGPNRTLVLLNGRRAGPAGTRGGVSSFDLNVLPQSIVKNVDILKTGASSIYGSDAIAGVVNLITKTDFNGFQLDGFGNVPTHSGGEQFSVSALWGKTFDRGHVMVALDYFKQKELARGDRSYLGCPEAYILQA